MKTPAWRLELPSLILCLVPGLWLTAKVLAQGIDCTALINLLDTRLINYLLEWGYVSLRGDAPGLSLWDPPFFYPEPNVLAYSDSFISAYPFYILPRLLGATAHVALMVYQLSQLLLTAVVTYGSLRWLGFSRWAACGAAMVFSWGWPRFFQLGHIQFSNGYLVPLLLVLLLKAFELRRPLLLSLAALVFALGFHQSVYIVYFSLLVGVVCVVIATVLAPRRIWGVVRSLRSMASSGEAKWALLVLLASLGFVLWGALHYKSAHTVLGGGDPNESLIYRSMLASWFRPSPDNLLFGRFSSYFPNEPTAPWEKNLFMGWLSLALAAAAVLRPRPNQHLSPIVVRALVLSAFLLMLFVSDFPSPFDFLERPFVWAQHHMPGFSAMRVSGRVVLVLSFIFALVAFDFAQSLPKGRISGALVMGLVLEALPPTPATAERCQADQTWHQLGSKVCELASQRQVGATLFLPADRTDFDRIFNQVPEMLESMSCKLPTLNGYTGHMPPASQPLFLHDPKSFDCEGVSRQVKRAATASGKPVLIYLERKGPLGAPAYPEESVKACFAACTKHEQVITLPTREGVIWVVDAC